MTKHRVRVAPRLALLRALYRIDGIEAVNRDLLRRTKHVADVLTAFGAIVTRPRGVIHGPLVIHNAERGFEHLNIGANAHVGRGVLLDLSSPCHIGSDATISMGCTLLTHFDVGDRPLRVDLPAMYAATRIGAGAYLGANVTVLAGCHIGDQAIVGAGAVVVRPVAAGTRVGGVPARAF